MAAARAVEPVSAVFALRIRETLFAFTLRTFAIHLALGDIVPENQSALGTDLGIPTVIGCFAARHRTDENGVAGIAPVFASSLLLANGAFFHGHIARLPTKQYETID